MQAAGGSRAHLLASCEGGGNPAGARAGVSFVSSAALDRSRVLPAALAAAAEGPGPAPPLARPPQRGGPQQQLRGSPANGLSADSSHLLDASSILQGSVDPGGLSAEAYLELAAAALQEGGAGSAVAVRMEELQILLGRRKEVLRQLDAVRSVRTAMVSGALPRGVPAAAVTRGHPQLARAVRAAAVGNGGEWKPRGGADGSARW